ncbi:hypothetical protein CPLU01_14914 [Colletotrichum plurivorum]|uniref:Uncharacterized protein n=1 Tax=Colletotrichum plurivorum TaxID=2175906 RepID=A0A8H6JGS7_9PEZI|nr:hypothetical protein CPLU01_14914 [Colletotrichum plurivorum]
MNPQMAEQLHGQSIDKPGIRDRFRSLTSFAGRKKDANEAGRFAVLHQETKAPHDHQQVVFHSIHRRDEKPALNRFAGAGNQEVPPEPKKRPKMEDGTRHQTSTLHLDQSQGFPGIGSSNVRGSNHQAYVGSPGSMPTTQESMYQHDLADQPIAMPEAELSTESPSVIRPHKGQTSQQSYTELPATKGIDPPVEMGDSTATLQDNIDPAELQEGDSQMIPSDHGETFGPESSQQSHNYHMSPRDQSITPPQPYDENTNNGKFHRAQDQANHAGKHYAAYRPGADHHSQYPETHHTRSISANQQIQYQATGSQQSARAEIMGRHMSTDSNRPVRARAHASVSNGITDTRDNMAHVAGRPPYLPGCPPSSPPRPPEQAQQLMGPMNNLADHQHNGTPIERSAELVQFDHQRHNSEYADSNGNRATSIASWRKPVSQEQISFGQMAQDNGFRTGRLSKMRNLGYQKGQPEAVGSVQPNFLNSGGFNSCSAADTNISMLVDSFSRQLEKRAVQLTKEQTSREEEVARLNQQIRDLQDSKDEYKKLRKREKSFEQSKTLLSQQNAQLETQAQEIGRQKTQIAGLLRDRDSLSGRFEKLRSNLGSRETELATASSHLRQAQEDIQRQNDEIAGLKRDYNILVGDSKHVREVLRSREAELATASSHLRQAQEDLDRQSIDFQQEKDRLVQEHNAVLQSANQQRRELRVRLEAECSRLENEKTAAQSQHQAEVNRLKMEHGETLSREKRELKASHDKDTKQLKQAIASKDLRIATYSAGGSYQPIHDSSFAQSLEGVSQQIRNLTLYVPNMTLPVDSSLDPTRYLGRNQGARSRQNFMRSVCWDIIFHGFFSAPLGFGSLGGEGDGYQALLQFYVLFARPDPEDVDSGSPVFPTDKETNMGRAWFFDGILKSVQANAAGNSFVAMFNANVSHVAEELTNALQHLGNGRLDSRAPAKVQDLTRQVGELALQMGAQRAQVFLEGCQHGDMIQPGERFCEEVESRGQVQVDLMMQPALVRVGDGREDLSSETVVAKGSMVSVGTAGLIMGNGQASWAE